jgi:hypothetical protein
MKIKFCALLVGASLLAFAGVGNAAQPLADGQLDSVTAGANWAVNATSTAVAVGNFDATTATFTNTYASQKDATLGFGAAIGQSYATGDAASAVTASILAVGSNSAAACVSGC